jgi:Cof subfamily protein (haloacid dehalogenase superfamily)
VLIRLIALDLDGTLLRSDGGVSNRTRAALAKVEAAQLTVVFVTARPPRRVRQIADDIGFRGLAICGNGAIVYDLASNQITRQTSLEATAASGLIEALRAALPGVCFATEAGLIYGQEPAYTAFSVNRLDTEALIADALDLCRSGVTKLIALHPTHPLEDLMRLTTNLVGNSAEVTHSGSHFIEIAAAGTTKAGALAELCAERSITAGEVIAFGDMPNDLPMLVWAGHSVAVANAHPDVLAVVGEVTLSNDDDGVAVVLERLHL